MSSLKYLILLAYYKRPKIVLNALDSIKKLKYENWELHFIDDSGDSSFKDTLFSFGLPLDKVKYIPTLDTDEVKKKNGGSRHGEFLNNSIRSTDSDVVIILCDDDALCDDYLNNLNIFYSNKTNMWGYCHVLFFDPYEEKIEQAKPYPKNPEIGWWMLNLPRCPSSPVNRLDGSQITFRISALKEKNITYPYPQTTNLDRAILQQMYSNYGECKFTSCIGQYKGWSTKQLGIRERVTNDIFTDNP